MPQLFIPGKRYEDKNLKISRSADADAVLSVTLFAHDSYEISCIPNIT